MRNYRFISVIVALLLFIVQLSAQTVGITGTADIPKEVEFITLYTQVGKAGILYPYVILFQDETGKSIDLKQAKKVLKRIKKRPVESIQFEGFKLGSTGNMANDPAAQNASAVVKSYGLHDYGKRDTPVYYFERKE